MRNLVGVALAGSLLLVACGGDDDSDGGKASTVEGDGADADAYVQALAETMTDDQEAFTLDDEAATCTATVLVDLVGTDALTAAGISPEDLAAADNFGDLDIEVPDDASARLSEGIEGCDITDRMVDLLIEQFATGAGGELPPEANTCLDEAIDRKALRDAVAASFVDGSGEDFRTLMFDAISTCPDVMAAIILAEAPASVGPEQRDCVRSVIEANSDLVRSAWLDQDPDATQQLGTLISTECPSTG
jgi:hypothetical protein